jgi:hypothetical protein
MKASIIFDETVPIPEKSTAGRPTKYKFHEMKVGMSFRGDHRARVAAAQYKHKNPGWDYYTRAEGDGLRIWRTA